MTTIPKSPEQIRFDALEMLASMDAQEKILAVESRSLAAQTEENMRQLLMVQGAKQAVQIILGMDSVPRHWSAPQQSGDESQDE